jgi:hypothetical protein
MESALPGDPDLAIGTAKEFLETMCKTVLGARNKAIDPHTDFPVLVKVALRELRLLPADIAKNQAAEASVKALLSGLGQVAQRLAEVRNAFGTGHGREASASRLEARHARLAVNAAIALGVFIYESHVESMNEE